MKKLYALPLLFLMLSLSSCGDGDKNPEEEKEEKGVVSKSWNYVKSGFRSEESLSEQDSLKAMKIRNHHKDLANKYTEYSRIGEWFSSQPKELRGAEGNFYKILKGVIQEGKSITRRNLVSSSENHSYLYFYETEEKFFIVELRPIGEKVECVNVRSIKRGFGEEPMYDYVFDEQGNLVQEIYQGDVGSSLYEEDGELFFKYYNTVNGVDLENSVHLGRTLEI